MADRNLTFGIFARDNGAERTFDRVGSAAERAGRKVDHAGRTSVTAGARFGKLGVGVGKTFSGLAGAVPIAAGVAVGIGVLGAKLVSSAASMELMNRKAHFVFGQSFPQVELWAKRVSTRMGLTSREVIGLTAGFADMLKPMGFTTSAATTMAQKFAAMAPILSEWSGGTVDLDQATQALQGAITGEYDSLQALGIPISAAKVQTEALKETGKKNAAALTDQELAAAALKLVYAGSGDAQKAYASGQGTLAARVKESKIRLAELRDTLIAKVTPWLTTAFTWFNAHWYDIVDGVLTIAEGAIALVGPLGKVASAGLRVGQALLYAAGARAYADGNIATGQRLWAMAGTLGRTADQAWVLGDRMRGAAAAVARLRDQVAAMRSKAITVSVDTVYRTIDLGGGRRSRGVGMNAAGTPSWRGGLTWVGERGAELVDLPAGTRIHDAQSSARIAARAATETLAPVQLVMDGRVVHEVLLKLKRSRGGTALGLA